MDFPGGVAVAEDVEPLSGMPAVEPSILLLVRCWVAPGDAAESLSIGLELTGPNRSVTVNPVPPPDGKVARLVWSHGAQTPSSSFGRRGRPDHARTDAGFHRGLREIGPAGDRGQPQCAQPVSR